MQGVYRIRNKLDSKRYVGSAQDFNERWDVHKKELRKGIHGNLHLQRAWNKYGEENFAFEVEEEVLGKQKLRLDIEQIYLDEGFELGNLYNVARKAGGGNLGEEVNQKISKASKGRPGLTGKESPNYGKRRTEEMNREKSKAQLEYFKTHENPFKGKHHTEKWKQEQSERMTGENHPMYGKKRPKHSKRMSGEGNPMFGKIGKDHPKYGKLCSEEAKAAIGKASSKPYPAFYNIETEEFIPAGRNLTKMCIRHGLSYGVACSLKADSTKQSRDGWRLATVEECKR